MVVVVYGKSAGTTRVQLFRTTEEAALLSSAFCFPVCANERWRMGTERAEGRGTIGTCAHWFAQTKFRALVLSRKQRNFQVMISVGPGRRSES